MRQSLKNIRYLPERNKWQVRFKINGKQFSQLCDSVDAAVSWRELQMKSDHPSEEVTEPISERVATCGELLPRWFDKPLTQYVQQSLSRIQCDMKNYLIPCFGLYPVSEVTPKIILNTLIEIYERPKSNGQKRAKKSIHNILAAITNFFEWCAVKE